LFRVIYDVWGRRRVYREQTEKVAEAAGRIVGEVREKLNELVQVREPVS
jgi:hypothetical protein